MKIGGFKLGKSKGKNATQEEDVAQIAEEILQGANEIDTPIRRNAPIQELSLDTGGENADSIADGETEAGAEDDAEAVKLVEVQPDPSIPPAPVTPVVSAPAAEQKKEPDKLDLNASIGNIFTNMEDEENPLANLVKALPDVAATELIDDLKEINDIIKDWQKK